MRIARGLIGLTAVVCFAGQALAAPICYQSDEVEASLAVKFMTELMVLNDACNQRVYNGFIRNNLTVLSAYHRQLVDHFRNAGDQRAEDTVDREVTRFANDIALVVGSVPIVTFCASKTAYFAVADQLTGAKFHAYVADLVTEHQNEFYRCGNPRSAAQ